MPYCMECGKKIANAKIYMGQPYCSSQCVTETMHRENRVIKQSKLDDVDRRFYDDAPDKEPDD